MRKFFLKSFTIACVLASGGVFAACSTGIEGTKTITMSVSEKRASLPSPEEEFVATLVATPLKEWKVGKRFMVSGDKFSLLLDPALSDLSSGLPDGAVISFEGVSSKPAPDGRELCSVVFREGGRSLVYPTGRGSDRAAATLGSCDIPMLIDLDLVRQADGLLRGRELWTRSGLWYDGSMAQLDGLKFVKVRVDSVTAGNEVFPFYVCFTDGRGIHARMPMTIDNGKNSAADSRVFRNLFFLSDPRLRHEGITEENWSLICRGMVAPGMTKDECRLSLGNPKEVDTGHDWNSTLDLWKYPDGRCLIFQDGLLSKVING